MAAGPLPSPARRIVPLAVAAFVSIIVWQVAAQMAPVSLAPAGAAPPAVPAAYPPLDPQSDVPLPPLRPAVDVTGNAVEPGTSGRTLAAPENRRGALFAVIGDRTAGREDGLKYLERTVSELNLLQPELVLSVGDQVEGYTRSERDYAAEALGYHQVMSRLQMPWYPCAGNHDVISGTRDSADRRFESLYQKYFGPLYYSLNFRDLHFIVLYSDEQLASEPALSDKQLAWLKADLNKAFDNRRIQHVFVLLHKPMWRSPKSNWNKVHELLVDFNRRPLVAIEGPGQTGGRTTGPRVEAVFAGHLHTFTQEPSRDGIAYYVLSVTGGAIDQDRFAGQLQSYLMVKVDAPTRPAPRDAGTVHIALVEPGGIHPDDFVTAADRAIAEKIYQLNESLIGIEGKLDQPVAKESGSKDQDAHLLKMVLTNPLDVPLDVAVRLASMKNLITPTQRDNANPQTDNYDSPWELYVPYQTKRLQPGEHVAYSMALYCPAQGAEVPPPQVEFVLSYTDSKGRTVPTVLKRRIPLVPSLALPLLKAPPTEADWDDAPRGGTYAFVPNVYDTRDLSPEFWLLADADNLYVKVRAEDKRFSYFPKFIEPNNLPSDAVSIAFAPSPATGNALVQRLIIFPFAPEKPLILTNNGVGRDQTPLLPLDVAAHPVSAAVTRETEAYELLITIPRKTILAGDAAVMNLTVTDNDDSAHSTFRSWAREDLGPQAWGRLQLQQPAR